MECQQGPGPGGCGWGGRDGVVREMSGDLCCQRAALTSGQWNTRADPGDWSPLAHTIRVQFFAVRMAGIPCCRILSLPATQYAVQSTA